MEHWRGPPWAIRHPGWGRRPTAPLAVLIGLIQVIGTGWRHQGLDALGYALLLAGPAALLLRRRYPVVTFAVAAGATLAYAVLDYPPGPSEVAAIVALLVAVRAGRLAPTAAVAAAGYLAYLWFQRPSLTQALVLGGWTVVLLVVAEASRMKTDQFAQGARIRAEETRARTEQRRRQASEERLRIARELHDVIGHHLSLINVQAGVGLHLMDTQPEQARTSLAAIKQASAEALREVRAVLGALKADDESAPRTPAPSLDRVAELCETAGLPVGLDMRGATRRLPPEVDRAAFRIVQEALTNVRRHAGPGATAQVIIEYADRTLTVRVQDDGTGAAWAQDGGAGIGGMRERATALGGTFTAGQRREQGGFRVEAMLPLEPTPPLEGP